MTLPLQAVKDPATDQNFRQTAMQFPIQAANIAKGAVTNEKLAKPPIAGAVSSAGAVTAGSGFSSEQTATGVYKITLTTELATVGVLIPASQLVGAEIYAASAPAKKVFEVKSFSTALVAKNMNFNFVIYPT